MILPSLTSIDWTFAAVAVWQWQPVTAPADDSAAAETPQPPSPGATPSLDGDAFAAPQPAADLCAGPALRLVFKGYEWQPMAIWQCQANPDWERAVDDGRDDSADRARRAERQRSGPPLPVVLPGAAGDPQAS